MYKFKYRYRKCECVIFKYLSFKLSKRKLMNILTDVTRLNFFEEARAAFLFLLE